MKKSNEDNCLRCGEALNQILTWKQLWTLKPIDWQYCCNQCWNQFEYCNSKDCCKYCQHPLENKGVCDDCRQWLTHYQNCYLQHQSIFLYNEGFQSWVTDYKYNGDIRQGRVMVPVIKQLFTQYRDYCWTFLPSSKINFEKRGFHQMEAILNYSKIPYNSLFLYNESLTTGSQAKKSRQERLKMVQPFILLPKNIEGLKILILDDVYTTGTTLLKAKELLFQANIQECLSITLARDTLK